MAWKATVREAIGGVEPWGAELADRADRAATPREFADAALRRIGQAGELKLDLDAVTRIVRCVATALGVPDKLWKRKLPLERVAEALTSMHVPFPLKRGWLDPDTMFAALRAYDPAESERREPYELKAPRIWTQSRTLAGVSERPQLGLTPFYFATPPDAHARMDAVADFYTEEARLSARTHGAELSILDRWRRDVAFRRKVYADALAHEHAVTPPALREAVFRCAKECTQFKPSLAVAVLRHFKATRVLDFSAGWGDRLIAAMAVPEVQVYHGFDPNPALQEGHVAMIARHLDRAADVRTTCAPAETQDFGEARYDLVFTSPPFFDVELYTDAPGQSIEGCQTSDAWLAKFLFPTLDRAWRALEDGGHLVLHMNNGRDLSLCEPTVLYAVARLPKCRFCGVMGSRGSVSGAVRPMWVFAKDAVDPAPAAQAEGELKTYYTRLHLRFSPVTLAPLTTRYFPMALQLLGNRGVMQWIADGKPWDRTRVKKLFKTIEEDPDGEHRHWAVLVGGTPCGITRVRPVNYAEGPRLTVMIEPWAQGGAVGTRAARLTLEAYGAPVHAEVNPRNGPSITMLERVGFTEQPTIQIRGKPNRSFVYGGGAASAGATTTGGGGGGGATTTAGAAAEV